MKKKPCPEEPSSGAKSKEKKKKSGRKRYLIPLITTLSVVGVTEEVMAKCKCEPIDDSASNYY